MLLFSGMRVISSYIVVGSTESTEQHTTCNITANVFRYEYEQA